MAKNSNGILIVGGILAAVFFMKRGNASAANNSSADTEQKRAWLISWANSRPPESDPARVVDGFNHFDANEVNAAYTFLTQYVLNNKPLLREDPLYAPMEAIYNRYHLFVGMF